MQIHLGKASDSNFHRQRKFASSAVLATAIVPAILIASASDRKPPTI